MQKYLYSIVSLGMIGSLYSMQYDKNLFSKYLVDVNEMSTLDEDYEKNKLFYDQLKREDEHVNRLMELSTSDDKQQNASNTQKKNTSVPERSWSIEERSNSSLFELDVKEMRIKAEKAYKYEHKSKLDKPVLLSLKSTYESAIANYQSKNLHDYSDDVIDYYVKDYIYNKEGLRIVKELLNQFK